MSCFQGQCSNMVALSPPKRSKLQLYDMFVSSTVSSSNWYLVPFLEPERMSNFFLYVYDGKEVTDWESFEMSSANLCFRQNGIPPPIFNFACDKRTKGRYMKLYKQYRYLPGDDALVLCEFEVYPKQGTRTEVTGIVKFLFSISITAPEGGGIQSLNQVVHSLDLTFYKQLSWCF